MIPPPKASLTYSWSVVFVLMLAYVSSFIDRQILSLLVGPIKRDMHLSDTEVSLLMGLSFALFYTLLGMGSGPATVTLPLIGTLFSWQLIFFYIGLPGLLLAGLVRMVVREPTRRNLLTNAAGQAETLSIGDVFRLIGQKRRAFFGVTLGITFVSMVAYASTGWIPTLFVRRFGWTTGHIGLLYGLVITVFSTAGILLGGRLADRFTRRGYADGKLRVGIIAAVGIGLSSGVCLITNPNVAVGLLAIPCFFVAFPLGASSAAIQEIMPNQARAMASAVYLLILNLIALGFGPTLVALLTDYVFQDEAQIHKSLAIVMGVGSLLALASYAWGLGAYRAAIRVPSSI